ncbi:MAG: NAD-dependent epimerase/dehydratase family protein [Patescibacteria group bacterium]
MTRALVTGAGGFIGKRLVEMLDASGWEVHATVRPGSKAPEAFYRSEHIHIHEVDVGDPSAVRSLVRTVKPDHVFHLAASLVASGSASSLESLVRSNVLGVASMLDAIAETPVSSAIFVGSCLEYGPKPGAIVEIDLCEPIESYGVTKLAGTLLAQAAGRTKELPIHIFRLFTPFGPGSQEGRLITEIVTRSLKNEPLLLSHPAVSRDFIYVDDVIDLFIEAVGRTDLPKGEIYNVGSGRSVTIEEAAATAILETGSASSMVWNAAHQAAYDADVWEADMTKTLAAFAWRPKHSFAEGMRKTISAFKDSEKS